MTSIEFVPDRFRDMVAFLMEVLGADYIEQLSGFTFHELVKYSERDEVELNAFEVDLINRYVLGPLGCRWIQGLPEQYYQKRPA